LKSFNVSFKLFPANWVAGPTFGSLFMAFASACKAKVIFFKDFKKVSPIMAGWEELLPPILIKSASKVILFLLASPISPTEAKLITFDEDNNILSLVLFNNNLPEFNII
jgi:hypothetical protein